MTVIYFANSMECFSVTITLIKEDAGVSQSRFVHNNYVKNLHILAAKYNRWYIKINCKLYDANDEFYKLTFNELSYWDIVVIICFNMLS